MKDSEKTLAAMKRAIVAEVEESGTDEFECAMALLFAAIELHLLLLKDTPEAFAAALEAAVSAYFTVRLGKQHDLPVERAREDPRYQYAIDLLVKVAEYHRKAKAGK